MTYTVATMPVPAAVWEMIRAKLKEAGYSHAIDEREGTLDMTHIALVRERPEESAGDARLAQAVTIAANAYMDARRERYAAIAECREHHGGKWPEDLTSGVMFWRGYKIHRDEFEHSKPA